MSDSDRPCVCGAMRIPTGELLITDTGTVHRHGGPCYVVPAVTGDGPASAANASFIAAAPDLVRDLLALVGAAWLERDEYAYAARKNWAAYQTCEDRAETAEGEVEKQRAAIMRVIAACVEADIESIAFNGEPGVIKTTTIRSALNGGSDEH